MKEEIKKQENEIQNFRLERKNIVTFTIACILIATIVFIPYVLPTILMYVTWIVVLGKLSTILVPEVL